MSKSPLQEFPPIVKLLILMGSSLLGLFLMQMIGLSIMAGLSGKSITEYQYIFMQPFDFPSMKWDLLFVQAMAALGGFVLMPYAFVRLFEPSFSFGNIPDNPSVFWIVVMLTMAFMVGNSVFIEWNEGIEFPDGFHQIAVQYEELAKRMTEFLTAFDSFGYFMVALLVVAVLPAMGEEFLFRGLVQRYFLRSLSNPHMAIWVAAVLFSAFHMQFFGFVPRMLLGALFGYLYYYSGSLWYSVLAHFINNGLTLVMLYLYQQHVTDLDLEDSESVPVYISLIFLVLGFALFVLFYRQFTSKDKPVNG